MGVDRAPQSVAPDRMLGRLKNSLCIGILGLPNVGKSTLFNLLTSSNVLAANFPFATKEPHKDTTEVPDNRIDWLVALYKPRKRTPAYLECVDIAGLVKGASEGQGLGNAFLSHIAAVDGLFHVSRIFESEEITHVEGDVDPIRDLQIIHEELRVKDINNAKRQAESLQRMVRGDKTKQPELDVVDKLIAVLEEGTDARLFAWSDKEIEVLNPMNLLTAKPMVYLVNMSEADYLGQSNKWLPRIKRWVSARAANDTIIPFSADFEKRLGGMPQDEVQAYLTQAKSRQMLPRIIKTGYARLHLTSFFTCGPDEVRAWTIREGTRAQQAAGVIHTDFEKFFICAEVMHYNDLKEHGSEASARAAGKYLKQGKAYVVQDGDVILFRHNASKGKSKK